MIDEKSKARLAGDLKKHFPEGPPRKHIADTELVLLKVLEAIAEAETEAGNVIHLGFETDGEDRPANVCGIYVFDGKDTDVIPISLSPMLVRIRRNIYFIGYHGWADKLLDVVSKEIDALIAAPKKAAS